VNDGMGVFLRQTLVVLPALNESACVAATIQLWRGLGAARVRVVDNGSTDDTAAVAQAAGAEVLREPRRGYGAAAWRGLGDWPADAMWVLFSSADGSDRLAMDELAAWQAAVDGGADLVVGDRVSHAAARAELKWTQRFGNGLTCAAIGLGWGRRFNDMGSLRLARREELVRLGLEDRGFGWNVEMQVRALEAGWKIVELPVQYQPRLAGESKISGSFAGTLRAGKGIVRMLWLLWRLRRQRDRWLSAAVAAPCSDGASQLKRSR
jgi:glycosyltransferase involved in cell wall biosynthesis